MGLITGVLRLLSFAFLDGDVSGDECILRYSLSLLAEIFICSV